MEENKGCVLLVDDEEPIRESLGELLEACGFEIFLADCYKAAVGVIEEKKDFLEAVLSDLKMPGESGLEILKYINEKDLNIPFLFLTGFGTLETCQEAVKQGAFDYILKPIEDRDKVVLPLRHAVDNYRLQKKTEEMQRDIIRMAEEHQKLLGEFLVDVEMKEDVQERIGKILDKWNP